MNTKTIVHLVHGTWGRGFKFHLKESFGLTPVTRFFGGLLIREAESESWIDNGSEFRTSIAAQLAQINPGRDILFKAFYWSGSNSYGARKSAAEEFKEYLNEEIQAYPDACHLVIAHSHGGTVVVDALSRANLPQDVVSSVGGILTLATPFITCVEKPKLEEPDVGRYMTAYLLYFSAALFFLITSLSYLYIRDYQNFVGWVICLIIGIGLPAISAIGFAQTRVGFVASAVRILKIALYFLALLGATFFAYQGATSSVDPGAGIEVAVFTRMVSMGLIIFDYIWIPVATVGTFLVVVLALTIGKQNGDKSKGILKQFYLSLALLGIAPVIFFATSLALESDSAISSNFLAFSPFVAIAFAFGASLLFVNNVNRVARLHRYIDALVESLEIRQLPLPLTALRLPRDEATISIVFAQIAIAISNGIVKLAVAPLEAFGRRSIIASVLFYSAGALLAYLGIDWSTITEVWYWQVLISIALGGFAIGLAAIIAMFAIAFILLLVKVLSTSIMALAVGWESAILSARGDVESEPLPRVSGTRPTALRIGWEALIPDAQERKAEDESMTERIKQQTSSLRHSIYEYEAIQKEIAQWILDSSRYGNDPDVSPESTNSFVQS